MLDSWRWGRGHCRHNTPSFEILRDYSQSSEILRGYDNYTIISGNPRTFSEQISDSNFLKLALRAKNEAYGGIKRKILLFRLRLLGFVSVSQFSGISNFYGGNKVQILEVDFKTSIFLVVTS